LSMGMDVLTPLPLFRVDNTRTAHSSTCSSAQSPFADRSARASPSPSAVGTGTQVDSAPWRLATHDTAVLIWVPPAARNWTSPLDRLARGWCVARWLPFGSVGPRRSGHAFCRQGREAQELPLRLSSARIRGSRRRSCWPLRMGVCRDGELFALFRTNACSDPGEAPVEHESSRGCRVSGLFVASGVGD